MKALIRDLTPPLLWRGLYRLKQRLKIGSIQEWEYIPVGWSAARANSQIKGWNVEAILDVYKTNWPTFLKNIEGVEPLGISPESNSDTRTNLVFHNIIISYGYALLVASRNLTRLKMLDWGGGIGHYYLLSKKLAPELEIDYHCKDLPLLANYGQTLFPEASFYSDNTCLNNKYDFVLASTSLHYSENWSQTFKQLASVTAGFLYIARLPVVKAADPFVIVQRPYQYGYNTEYLGWCLNRDSFLEEAQNNGLILIREFIHQESSLILNAPEKPAYHGYLFRKIK